jgi:hypothetical protein
MELPPQEEHSLMPLQERRLGAAARMTRNKLVR